MAKYELLAEKSVTVNGVKLFRIRATAAFGSVRAGDEGGFIESESNLSQSGEAWVSGKAQVFDEARVSGKAQVFDEARVSGEAGVSDEARVSGKAQVFGEAQVSLTPVVVLGLDYQVTVSDNALAAGCQCHTFAAWRSKTPQDIAGMDGAKATAFYPTLLAILVALGK